MDALINHLKDFQALIVGILALIGAGFVIVTTKMQIKASSKADDEKQKNEIQKLAAILAVEADMSLQSAGFVAKYLYNDPGVPLDQDFHFQIFNENLSKLGGLPGDLPEQVMYCFRSVIALQNQVRERAQAIVSGSDPKSDENIQKTTITAVDRAATLVVELALLTPWLEHVAKTGEALTLENAMSKLPQAIDRVNPVAQQLTMIKVNEGLAKNQNFKKA